MVASAETLLHAMQEMPKGTDLDHWQMFLNTTARFHVLASTTVILLSKGPGIKGNLPLKDIDLSSTIVFYNYSYIGIKRISIYGKN